MKTIVVVSDSHGYKRGLEELFPVFAENDMIIHLGDTSGDGSHIRAAFPDKTVVINGNCDFASLGDDESVIAVEGVKIFACHGHRYSVKSTLSKLAVKARREGCRIALYGHTHTAREDVLEGVTLLNPGCGTRYGERSYLYLVVNGEKFTYKIVPIQDK